MEGFNRKRPISWLAASALVTAATLAPLPGFLATVHAAPANFIQVSNPAHIDLTTNTGLNGIALTLSYSCTAAGGATAIQASATQTGGGTGDTGTFAGGNPIQGLTCDGASHQVEATLFPNAGTSFTLGTASVSAQLIDNTNATVGTAVTALTVRVI
jgi:hypothetical protein